MKKIFRTVSIVLCAVFALIFTSCSSKPVTYEEFHEKAFEVESTGPIYREGHFYMNIDTVDEKFTYESDFTISAYGTVSLSTKVNNIKWEASILYTIKMRASTLSDAEGREYYINKDGFVAKDIYNDEVTYQYEFDEYGYLIKAYDPYLNENYIRTITWN